MRFYIATGLVNAEHARKAAEVLRRNGHEQTYDWTTHGDIRHEGAERMSEVAFNELRAEALPVSFRIHDFRSLFPPQPAAIQLVKRTCNSLSAL